ncbi:hypothetical protein [Nocardia sp. NRRL S-836]|uniref:hypothetical protein n=1 Tax=Nocardia sp. NRRL S-836 TaxID=1519492 RepID=UPI0006ADB846|nr:hypothetical protein [Nocardia sp. NRRL S-836]KOV82450.1 hypothetical protein ADL03_24305 [Nocardia sp. NRRL S-836]
MKLNGVLAIRQSWCAPGEPVLVCVPGGRGAMRFDVGGLDWWGKPERGVVGKVVAGVASVPFALATADDWQDSATPPNVVVFGPRPDALAMRPWQSLDGSAQVWCVLTPRRFAWVAAVEESEGPEQEVSLLDQVRGFAKTAKDVLSGKGLYPAHRPVETVAIRSVGELPRAQIAGIAVAERKLPRKNLTYRDAHVLRVSFVDGSGVDLLAGPRPDQAHRLLAMANGQG